MDFEDVLGLLILTLGGSLVIGVFLVLMKALWLGLLWAIAL
jgi:hypothetical protein